METRLIDDSFDPNAYNEHAAHPMQTWEWGDAKKELGNKVVRIGEFDQGKLEHVFQMTLHTIPKTPYKVGYLPRSNMPSHQTLDFLKEYARKHSTIFIKLEPNVLKSKLNKKIPAILTKSSHPLFPSWTQTLDLRPSLEELLKNCKSKTRYNIRLAEKKGVLVKELSDEKGFKIFADLYFDTTKRQKYFGHDRQYHQVIWDHMKKGIAHLLIAFHQNTPLAAYELFYFKKTLYYPYGGSSEQYRNLMGANLLMWKTIELGKKLGAETYDMWGSLPPDYSPNDPWAGFTRFKEGYNTRFVEFMGTYDLVANPALYVLYGALNKARTAFLKLKA